MAVKTSWAAGDVLTAADLTDTFAAKAALASPALTGTPTAPTAAAGTNTTQIATTAFVQSAGGFVLVAPTSIANSGGSASASGGAVSFSGVTSISLNGVFSATYENYRIVLTTTIATSADNNFRLRVSGSDNATASSYVAQRLTASSTTVAGQRTTDSQWAVWQASVTRMNGVVMDIFRPFATDTTAIQSFVASSDVGGYLAFYVGTHNQSASYDGFTLLSAQALTGTVRVYGYKN